MTRFCAGGNATSTKRQELAKLDDDLHRWECDTHKAPGARAPGASAAAQPTLHVAPSRAVRDGDVGGSQAVAQLVGARPVLGGARSGPLGQHGPDQRVQRLVLGGGRTGRTRTDAGLAARARQYADRDSPATRPCKTLRKPLANQVAHSLVPARRA